MVEPINQIKSGITINVDASANKYLREKGYIQNPVTCAWKNIY